MHRYVKIFFSVIFTTIIFFSFAKCSAEDLRFIDANGDTGYYVDASTIRVESDSVFYVDFDIIRAGINQMEVINLRINHWEKIYQVMSIKTLSYDERTELKSDDNYRHPSSYAEKSLIGDIVRFVLTGSL
ncbi:MAG: hypothetical protein IKZ58_01200 [Selenomonadaceae bacterium]|nr:hypothetical protein [Selenomonadaceae bacterium]